MKFSGLSPEDRFKILNEFLGWGNPDGPLWFIGLEEAEKWKEDPLRDEEMYERYAKKIFPVTPGEIARDARRSGRRFTQVYEVMSKLTLALIGQDEAALEHWEEYRNEKLLIDGGLTFQMNLYPLGKKRLDEWPKHYRSVFGFGREDLDRYREGVKKERFRLLRNEWERHQPRLTVCFGRTGWDDFEEFFKGRLDREAEGLEFCKVFRISGRGVVLTPFFWRPSMTNKKILDLAALLTRLFPLSPENPR